MISDCFVEFSVVSLLSSETCVVSTIPNFISFISSFSSSSEFDSVEISFCVSFKKDSDKSDDSEDVLEIFPSFSDCSGLSTFDFFSCLSLSFDAAFSDVSIPSSFFFISAFISLILGISSSLPPP